MRGVGLERGRKEKEKKGVGGRWKREESEGED